MPIATEFLVVAVLLLATTCATASTVHDELPKYGLPPGLLPDSVVSYSVGSSGEFEVEFSSPCYVKFSDLVHYEKKVKGRLSYGAITDLEGILLKKVFFWVPITGIVADPHGATLNFQIGFLSEKLPVALFETIPHCIAKASCRSSGYFLAEEAVLVSEV
ncbi:hypothetical protein KSP39_PZI004315 [Platanthera zijinensis]|uniref:Uncharacterized protein n=1 Tax=Platanthera zijinensis TaxID=2320716 RepID=A0AAP0GDM0_9ASPA